MYYCHGISLFTWHTKQRDKCYNNSKCNKGKKKWHYFQNVTVT